MNTASCSTHVAALADSTLRELLADARRAYSAAPDEHVRQYARFIIELELEAFRRDLEIDAPTERCAPLDYLRGTRRQDEVRRQLECAAEAGDADAFRDLLRFVHPDDVSGAWYLVNTFRPDFATVAHLLRIILFVASLHATRDYGAALAAVCMLEDEDDKPIDSILKIEEALITDLQLRMPDNSLRAGYERWCAFVGQRKEVAVNDTLVDREDVAHG